MEHRDVVVRTEVSRRLAMERVQASSRLEGLSLDPDAQALFERFADSDATGEDLVTHLLRLPLP